MGRLQFAVRLLQFLVGNPEAAGAADAEEEEDGEGEYDDAGDDDDTKTLLLGLLHFETGLFLGLLGFQFIDVQEGVHLRQLPFGIVNIDGVVDDVHLIVELCRLFITSECLEELGALQTDAESFRLVAGVVQHPHTAVVEGDALIVESL